MMGMGASRTSPKQPALISSSHSLPVPFFFDYDNDGQLDLLVLNVGKYTGDKKGAQGQYVGLPDAFAGHLHPQRYEYPGPLQESRPQPLQRRDRGGRPAPDRMVWGRNLCRFERQTVSRPVLSEHAGPQHHYLENADGKSFADKTEQYFPKTPWGAMGVKFFDFDNDGRMDLIITDMHSDMSEIRSIRDQEKLKSTMCWLQTRS